MVSVLYVEPSEHVARGVKNEFTGDENIEFLTAQSAKDALEILDARDIFMILLDVGVQDMKFRDFIGRCTDKYPDIVFDICIDVGDAKALAEISAIPSVRKILLPPWNIEEIVENVYSAIDERKVEDDLKKRIRELDDEEKDFEKELAGLRDSLMRQQYSYNRIAPLFNKLVGGMLGASDLDGRMKAVIGKTCEKMLKLQLTTSVKTLGFNKIITDNLDELREDYPNVTVGEVDSCLMGDVSKNHLADTVLLLWLIAYKEACLADGRPIVISVDSRYLTSDSFEFCLKTEGIEETGETEEDISKYTERILYALAENVETDRTGNTAACTFTVNTCRS